MSNQVNRIIWNPGPSPSNTSGLFYIARNAGKIRVHYVYYTSWDTASLSLSNKNVTILCLVLHSQWWCIFHFTLDCKNVTVEQMLAKSNNISFHFWNCIMHSRYVVIVEGWNSYQLGFKSWPSGVGWSNASYETCSLICRKSYCDEDQYKKLWFFFSICEKWTDVCGRALDRNSVLLPFDLMKLLYSLHL